MLPASFSIRLPLEHQYDSRWAEEILFIMAMCDSCLFSLTLYYSVLTLSRRNYTRVARSCPATARLLFLSHVVLGEGGLSRKNASIPYLTNGDDAASNGSEQGCGQA